MRDRTAIVGVGATPQGKITRRRVEAMGVSRIGLMAIPAVFLAGPVPAQDVASFPAKAIRVVVPQPPGGTTDAVARLFAARMAGLLGQQIVIDNRSGGGVATVAAELLVAGANPDGYTLLAMISMFFLSEAGIRSQVTYVPYKGTGLAFIDLMAGRLHAAMSSIVSAGPHVKAGKLHALGVTTSQRSPEWPDVPTIAEQGLAGFEATAWYGLAVPAKTPAAIVNKLSAAAGQAARSSEIGSAIRSLGGEPVGSTPAEFRKLIASEIPRWRALVGELGMAGTLN